MKSFILLSFVLCSFLGFSQINHEDGEFKEYHKNGNLKIVGVYKNNKKVGDWKVYYNNGQLESEKSYLPNGEWAKGRQYNTDGKLLWERQKDASGNEVNKHYFENGNLKIEHKRVPTDEEESFLKKGSYKEFFENGNIKLESNYSENVLSGVWKQFYPSTEIEWEVEYLNGYKQGTYRKFFKNGIIEFEGSHDLDLKDGVEKLYDQQGTLIQELKYKKGELKNSSKGKDIKTAIVPEDLTEKMPVYPGCENKINNKQRSKCLSSAISDFVITKFNTTFAKDTNLKGEQKIQILFKIDITGNVIDIRAKAPHKALEAEAIRVLALLPKIKPGFQYGKPVNVPFSMPVIFNIIDNKNTDK